MSVFTPVSLDEARAFVAAYHVGEVIDFQDIAAGVENSNFFVTTTEGRFVLTLFEKIPRADLDFYLGLMMHAHLAGVACAKPLSSAAGEVIRSLNGKPATLVERLKGGDIAHPTALDCQRIGVALARLHIAADGFKLPMPNWRGLAWWRREAMGLGAKVSESERSLLMSELDYQSNVSNFDQLQLPKGIVHGDLFRDNVLWTDLDGTPTPQLIDFYFACHEQLLLDVAITVNDWCVDFALYPQARLHLEKTRALLAGYASVRAFTSAEVTAWPQVLRAAALRTWLGRLGYHYTPRDSTLTHPKDHPFSERLLREHIARSSHYQHF